jgi:hypothetical protein
LWALGVANFEANTLRPTFPDCKFPTDLATRTAPDGINSCDDLIAASAALCTEVEVLCYPSPPASPPTAPPQSTGVLGAAVLAGGVLIAVIAAPIVVILCIVGIIVACCCAKKKRNPRPPSTQVSLGQSAGGTEIKVTGDVKTFV